MGISGSKKSSEENSHGQNIDKKNMHLEENPGFITSSVDLSNATFKNTEWFALKDFVVPAKVVKVYDGDTCTCVFDTMGLGLYKHSVRLSGIDTPEIKSSNPKEKTRAIEVRDFLKNLILNKIVQLHCKGSDKYGRVLGVISTEDGVDINNLLVENGMALRYDGGKKKTFDFS